MRASVPTVVPIDEKRTFRHLGASAIQAALKGLAHSCAKIRFDGRGRDVIAGELAAPPHEDQWTVVKHARYCRLLLGGSI